jgi:integrase
MPRNLIASDLSIRKVKSDDKRKRLSDGDGLYLLLFVKGGSHGWRFDYTINRKRKTISLGTFPDVGLGAARERADQCRELVAQGVDPSEARQEKKRAADHHEAVRRAVEAGAPVPGTFRAVAEDWLTHQAARWEADTRDTIRASFVNDVYPEIGHAPMGDIKAKDVLRCILKIEGRGAGDMAGRVLQRVKSVFRFAIVHEVIESNPTLDLKSSELLKPRKVKHRAALPESEMGRFLALLSEYGNQAGGATAANALRFLMLTATRPGDVRGAMWSEISGSTWRIPGGRMKMGEDYVTSLSRQALAVLEDMRPISGMDSLVFPSPFYPGKPLSENTLNSAMARIGYKGIATAHGFRSLFSTVANEHGFDPDVIERQLDHVERNQTRAAYHRAAYTAERAALMQWWADFIDQAAAKFHQSTP